MYSVPRATHSAPPPTGLAPLQVEQRELSDDVRGIDPCEGPGGQPYPAARVLVRLHSHPLGTVDVPLPADGDGRRFGFELSDRLVGPIEGSVELRAAPADRGTEVRLEGEYRPPLRPVGIALSRLSPSEPARGAEDWLRRLKEIVETGSEVESDATAGGHRLAQRAAQPPADAEASGQRQEVV
jgi:hypothetical protein